MGISVVISIIESAYICSVEDALSAQLASRMGTAGINYAEPSSNCSMFASLDTRPLAIVS